MFFGHMPNSGIAVLLSIVAVPVCTPTSNAECSPSSISRQHELSLASLILIILVGVRWALKVFVFAYPWGLKMLSISLSVSQSFEFPLLGNLFKYAPHLLIGFILFLIPSSVSSLYILDY